MSVKEASSPEQYAGRLSRNRCGRCGQRPPARDSGWCRLCLKAATWLQHDEILPTPKTVPLEAVQARILEPSSQVEMGHRMSSVAVATEMVPEAPESRERPSKRHVACVYCGAEFEAQRSSARYCSEACKKADKRAHTSVRLPAEADIYFIHDGTYMKIGWAVDAHKRLAELQVGNARPLYLKGVVRGHPDLERQLHRRFAKYRVKGEWFRMGRNAPDWDEVIREHS